MTQRSNLTEGDRKFHLHPFTNFRRHEKEGPLTIVRGEGIWVYDDSGRRYLEALAGLWCVALGFNNARLIDAAKRQLDRIPYYHTFYQRTTDVTAELAERLAHLVPIKDAHVMFANSGSEANDMAIKLIWYYNNARGRPAKKKIISRQKGYHGVTIAAGSLTGLPIVQAHFDLPIARFLHTDCPHYYLGSEEGESVETFVKRCVRNLEELIEREGPETIAAFIAEPIQASGGVIVPPPGYFEAIQQVLRRHEILFIADEVICGFGRTGKMFGSQTFSLTPDLVTVAKGLSSGYQPISALAISTALYEVVAEASDRNGVFGHGFTYSGHPVAAAVALEAIKIYEEGEVLANVHAVMNKFQSALRGFKDHPLVGEVRAEGLIAGIQLMADGERRIPFDPAEKVGARFTEHALKEGWITRALGDTIAFCPPLIINAEEIDVLTDMVRATLDATYRAVSSRADR